MAQHRADRQRPVAARTPVPASIPGRRRAERPSHRSRLRRSPSLPTAVGLAVLALAGAGAITVGHPQSAPGAVAASSHGRQFAGTDAVSQVDGSRQRALSRDSERQALQDAATAKVQPATDEQGAERNAELKSLGKAAEARAGQIAKNQWHLPTRDYHLTARFGMAGGLWSSNHTGLDFAAPTGTPIFAVANGVITETGWAGAYGNRTVETLPDGTELWYAHQSAIGVRVGQRVIGGQTIGAVGSTGNTTGPHVHLEVRPGGGDPVDPYQALIFHGVHP